jgi:putative endonuclease
VPEKLYWVYILASRSSNLYTGLTNNLVRRVHEHREGIIGGFTKKYRIHRLVYCESFHDVRTAIAREKQVKAWRREKRVALIESQNPAWEDLAEQWFTAGQNKNDKQIPPPTSSGSG